MKKVVDTFIAHPQKVIIPMKSILSLLLAFASCEAKSIVNEDLIHKVGIIESNLNEDAVGDNGRSLGAFQISQETWEDAVAYCRVNAKPHEYFLTSDWKRGAHDYEMSHRAAGMILKMHEERMIKNRIKPTPMKLYMAYNMGYMGASQFNFNVNVTYGKRKAILLRAQQILSK